MKQIFIFLFLLFFFVGCIAPDYTIKIFDGVEYHYINKIIDIFSNGKIVSTFTGNFFITEKSNGSLIITLVYPDRDPVIWFFWDKWHKWYNIREKEELAP